jgi:hypothetical protein
MLSENNGMELEFNNKRNYIKYPKTWSLNNSFLNDQRNRIEILKILG